VIRLTDQDGKKGQAGPTISIPAIASTLHGDAFDGIKDLCQHTGQPVPTATLGCYLPFPITDNSNGPGDVAHVVTFACFQVFYPNGTIRSNDLIEGILSDPANHPSCQTLPGDYHPIYGTDPILTP
jgi:hypothetical protein